jgi:hypothetical protein
MHFRSVLICVLLATSSVALAEPYVNRRLANMVEAALRETGFKVNIPPKGMEPYSLHISQVNGRDVCSPDAEADVRRLQQAFDNQPDIYRNFSGYLISVTAADGTRKVSDYATIKTQGIAKADCINLYIEVRPD